MFIKQEFKVVFEVLEVGSVKQWKDGENDGNKYKPSVKFRAVNVENKEDKDVGVREIETIVDFQVHTDTVEQVIYLVEAIRKFRADKKSISIVGDLPNKQGTDQILVIKNAETLQEFLDRNKMTLNIPSVKK